MSEPEINPETVAVSVTGASDLQTTAVTPQDKMSAHKAAVDLVRQEAEYMLTSGDQATAGVARRIHILSSALGFILNADWDIDDVKADAAQPAAPPAASPSPFEDRINAADAAATGV